jgi:hypothetical protein
MLIAVRIIVMATNQNASTALSGTEFTGKDVQTESVDPVAVTSDKLETSPMTFATSATDKALYVSPSGSDSNDGSKDQPFRSISAASQHATPGTTVHVAPGTYAGGFDTTTSGTATNPITYVSTVPGGAIIRGGGATSGGEAVVWRLSGSYCKIQGFNINGDSSPQVRSLIYVTGGHNIIADNTVQNLLTNQAQFQAQNASGGGAITLTDYYQGSAAWGNQIISNKILNTGPAGATSNTVHAIYNDSQSSIIANNVIDRAASVGIHSWGDDANARIENNTVLNCKIGILNGGSGATASGMITSNNIVANNQYGISEQGATDISNIYTNNLTWNNANYDYSLQNGLTPSGSVHANPLFVNAAAHDYRLQADSPAIGSAAGASLSMPLEGTL